MTPMPVPELASPLFAPDLGGLPPVRIEVGESEVLIDDATRLAERLEEAGAGVSLIVWPQLLHVFQAFPGSVIPESGPEHRRDRVVPGPAPGSGPGYGRSAQAGLTPQREEHPMQEFSGEDSGGDRCRQRDRAGVEHRIRF